MPGGPGDGSSPIAGDELRRVRSFELIEELGRGGMGVVYRARDLKLQREVALKRPRLDLLDRPGFRSRFMGEARASSKLMHPNIVTVFEVFEDDGVPWLVMEFIDGAGLRSLLADGRPLPLEKIFRYAEGLTDALRVAHIGGILHRDINPNNILVGKDGRARLSDFGLAQAYVDLEERGQYSEESTEEGASSGIVGTRGYMAPEQALGKPVDRRSDVFSLGSVFYEMCTGDRAFSGPGAADWLDALLHREPSSISSLNSDVPREFENVVRKAIAKRQFQRYQSANEMLLDIRAVRRQFESTSDLGWHGFMPSSRRKRIWYAVAGAAVVALVTIGVQRMAVGPGGAGPAIGPTHQRLTTEPGWEGEPALSPDGNMIAYCSDQSGNPDIWIVPPSGGDPLQLTTHPGSDTNPAWFPDGSKIVFVSDRGGERAIWRVPFLGGTPVMLVPNAEDPAISPGAERIAFARAGPSGDLRIHVAPLDDPSSASVLTGNDHGQWDHENPSWSPDGKMICYADFRDLWLLPLDGGPPRKLTTKDVGDRNPAWWADGRHVIFDSGRDNTVALWRVDVEGGEPNRLTAGTGDEGQPSLSHDGRWLAYATRQHNPEIFVLDRQTGSEVTITGATMENEPAIAHDGSSVVFMSDRRGPYDLWIQPLHNGRLDGTPRQLTDHPGIAAVPDFSPDGRWIAYFRVLEGQIDIWTVPVTGGPSRQFTDHPADDIHPSFSPDGTQLAFISSRDGFDNIWVAAVADGVRSGEPKQVTHGKAVYLFPAWSPDGQKIAFTVDRGFDSEVFVAELGLETPPVQLTRGARAASALWHPTGEKLLVSGAWGDDHLSLRWVAVADGSSHPFEPELKLGAEDSIAGLFALDREWRYMAYAVVERKGDVWLAEMVAGRR